MDKTILQRIGGGWLAKLATRTGIAGRARLAKLARPAEVTRLAAFTKLATLAAAAGWVGLAACRPKTAPAAPPYLPRFHFTAGSAWTGEPAGLVYDKGTYHLFYQYNPTGDQYGSIHWGHAVSRDLYQWRLQPVALAPEPSESLGSGSVVADLQNTSGFGNGTEAPFIAFYTVASSGSAAGSTSDPEPGSNLRSAYSLDQGVTWTSGAPLALPVPPGETLRNPHVSWNRKANQWLMTVSTGSSVLFYTSPDCRQWTYRSEFKDPAAAGNLWEETDFFPLKAEDSDSTRWILLVSAGNGAAGDLPAMRYFVGDFDGAAFHLRQPQETVLDYGKDHTAGSTFNGLGDNRRIELGWMNHWEYANLLPTSGWRGNMTCPRWLTLVREGNRYRLASVPYSGWERYRSDSYAIPGATLSDNQTIRDRFPYPGASFTIRLKFDPTDSHAIWKARTYGIRLKTRSGSTLTVGYQNELSAYYIDRSGWDTEPFAEGFGRMAGASYRSASAVSDWYLLFDRNSIEFFADGGRIALTALCYPDDELRSFELFAESGSVTLLEGDLVKLKN